MRSVQLLQVFCSLQITLPLTSRIHITYRRVLMKRCSEDGNEQRPHYMRVIRRMVVVLWLLAAQSWHNRHC